jgi:hypothetical protein
MRRSETLMARPSVRAAVGSACARFGCGGFGGLVFRQHIESVERRWQESGGRHRPTRKAFSESGHQARSKGGLRANRVW